MSSAGTLASSTDATLRFLYFSFVCGRQSFKLNPSDAKVSLNVFLATPSVLKSCDIVNSKLVRLDSSSKNVRTALSVWEVV